VTGMERRQLSWQRGQQATDEVGGDDLGWAGEEGWGEVVGCRGGYGSGFLRICGAMQSAAQGGNKLFAHSLLDAMSEEQLNAFLEAAKSDAGLQEHLKAAGDADAVVAIASKAGFRISVEDVNLAQEANSTKWCGFLCVGPEEDWTDCMNEVPMPPVPLDEELKASEEMQTEWKFLCHEWHEIDHLKTAIQCQQNSRQVQPKALENKAEEKKAIWRNTDLDDCIW
jgi:predicted ribosomally synthesized peptide with nif11-like leader